MQVGKTTVHKDLAYLSLQTKESPRTHVQGKLPEEYQKCMVGINQVLNMAWSIVNKSAGVDDKTRLQALALINDCNKYKMDLTTNGVVITDAIKYVQGKMDHLNRQEKKLLQDIQPKQQQQQEEENGEPNEESAQAETTNGVF